MTPERLQLEILLLEKYFPKRFRFVNLYLPDEYLDVGWKTQNGTVYRLNIRLNADYPNSLPRVYVVYPLPLLKKNGAVLSGASHEMHTLSNDGEMIQICHFKTEKWNPNQSLYKIILKARIWLECYERHLATGETVDSFIKKIN